MKTPRRRNRRGQGGFTLIELMISLVMFSFAIAGILAVAVAMAAGFREQKQAIGAEGNSRAAMEFLADAIRGASPGLLGGNSATLEDISVAAGSCPVGPFLMTDNVGAPSTDELTVVFAYGSVVTSSTTLYTPRFATITVVDGSQFTAGDHVLITNFGTGHLVRITTVTGNVLDLDTGSACTISLATATYNPGSLVIRATRARFTSLPSMASRHCGWIPTRRVRRWANRSPRGSRTSRSSSGRILPTTGS